MKTSHLRRVSWICSSIFLESNICIQTEQERNSFQISCSALARAWENNELQLKHWQLIAQAVSPSKPTYYEGILLLSFYTFIPF